MQVEEIEINGFQIENFNQHGLEAGKTQGICPLCSSSRKPENMVSVLAITVIALFNYIHINVKVKLNVNILCLKLKRLIL